jgi:hypothetical protein
MREHLAYNLITGEVVVCNTANQLKRAVKAATNANRPYMHGESQKWKFYHGARARLITG